MAVASEIQEPSLRLAAFQSLGIATSRETLRAAFTETPPETDEWDKRPAAVLLASTLPPELLGELLTATRTFGSWTGNILEAMAPRLPDGLLSVAVKIIEDMNNFDRPGKALAALAPRLSGRTLRGRSAARPISTNTKIASRHSTNWRYATRTAKRPDS